METGRYISPKALTKTKSQGLHTDTAAIPGPQKPLLGDNPQQSTTTFDPVSRENLFVHQSSMGTQALLAANARASGTAFRASSTHLYNQVQRDRSLDPFEARANPTAGHSLAEATTDVELTTYLITLTFTGVFTTESTGTLPNGEVTVRPITATATRTQTTEITSLMLAASIERARPANQTGAIAGGVAGATAIIILGLIVFCIVRRKRRSRAARSISTLAVSTSTDVIEQRMPQSTQLSTTPRPFLDFHVLQSRSSRSKGRVPKHVRGLPAQDLQREIELVEDPFRDPMPVEGNPSNNDDEGPRARNALIHLQALTSQFEGEIQQLCVQTQSGQLSAEDRLKLEEIRRATGLTIQFDPRHDRFSIVRSISSGSSSEAPPSYHTRST